MRFRTRSKCKPGLARDRSHIIQHTDRIIAGNHDLTLDEEFCEKNPDWGHFGGELFNPQVC
jgi:hypothetical protein